MKSRLVATLVVTALAATALLMLATTASAAGQGKSNNRMIVSGNSTPSEAGCNNGEGAGAIELTGDIEGCLTFFPKRFKCVERNGFDKYVEWGREAFKGSLKGKDGTFRTKYKIVATYASGSCEKFNNDEFPFEDQITGGCKHRVIGQTGAFKRYRGLLTFHDQIPEVGKGATNFLYEGHLKKRGK